MKYQNKFVNLFIISFLLLLAIVACSPSGSGGDVEPDVEAGAVLDGTSWVLNELGPEDALTAVLPDTTITLNFADDGINGSAGCNSYFGEASQSGSSLTFGAIGSTRMACPEPIMQQENAYLAALGTVSSFTLEGDQLTLDYEDGRLVFAAGVVEESNDKAAEANEEEATKTLFVGPELVDCVGVGPQKCMQVRQSEDAEWTLFYDQIVGFEYEPGYEYELRVSETKIDNPPADASSLELTLVEVVRKTAVSPTPVSRPESNELQGTHWVLTTFGPNDNQTAVLPDTELTLNFDGEQINGTAGCNGYFADVSIEADGKLSVGLVESTVMACLGENVMQQESDFLAMLAEATSYTLSGSGLTLHTNDGSLTFVAATMHETNAEGAEIVDWETAVSLLNSGEVVEIFQTHSLDVTLTLVDGRIVKTVEPAIDDIFSAIEDCSEPCSNILMATE